MAQIMNKIKQRLRKKLVRTVYTAVKPYEIKISNEPELKGKVAVVTGGSGAIGRAICFRLAAMGAKVYISGRNRENVDNVVSEIREDGLLAEPFIMDVTDENSVNSAFDSLFGVGNNTFDILVNCAGGGARGKMSVLAEQSVEVIDDILSSNLRGTMLCTRKAAQYMAPRNKGKIVIISSAVGLQGKAKYSEYAAAKSGMFGFVKAMALELGPHNINVNCVTPGFIQRGEYDDNQLEYLEKSNAMHKVGTLEDVASAVAFMVSDQAAFITGQNLVVDGGRSLGLMGD